MRLLPLVPVELQNTTFIAPLPFATPKIKAEWEARQARRYRQPAPPREAVAFWSDKRFMRWLMTTDAIFGPLSSSRSGELAPLYGCPMTVREGNTWLSDDGVTYRGDSQLSPREREVCLSGRRREGMI